MQALSSSTTPPPVPVKQKSTTSQDNVVRANDSPTNTPPRVPERRPSIAHMPAPDLTNGKRNSALDEDEEFTGPPIPKRTVSFNRSIVKPESEDTSSTSTPKKSDQPDSPKPPPIPKKKTPLKVMFTYLVTYYDCSAIGSTNCW